MNNFNKLTTMSAPDGMGFAHPDILANPILVADIINSNIMSVKIQLNTFTCNNADEDSWYSNGDEPYLLVMAIFADGSTINIKELPSASVRIFSPTKTHGNLNHSNVNAGKSFAIPENTGLFVTNMKPIDGLPVDLGKKMALAGIAVIAMEEDATPTTAVNKGRVAMINETKKKLNETVKNIVSALNLNEAVIKGIVDDVRNKVISTITKECLKSISGIFSFADPDDFINSAFNYWSYAAIESAGAAGIPFTMSFKKSGVDYSIDGIITRT